MTDPLRLALPPLLLAVLISACDILSPVEVVLDELQVVSGDAQAAPVAGPLPRDLVVRAVDTLGAPIPGEKLAWRADSGTIDGDTATDAQGYARATWTLGTVSGGFRAWVSSRSARGVETVFRVTAQPGPVARVRLTAGDEQSVAEGNTLPDSLAIRVQDAHGNPVPGVRVEWKVTRGGGSVRAPTPPVTDARGAAAAAWQVGIALPNRAFARVGTDTVQFRASPTLLSPRDTVRLAVGAGELKYLDVRIATDTTTARTGRMVAVFYSEYLLDGTLLQRVRSGVDAPLRFTLGAPGVIPGFNEGVRGMRRGSIRRLVVPPAIGYNDGVMRVFDVELSDVLR